MNIFEKLKERGFTTVPESFYTNIAAWKCWYDGEVKNFHQYKVYNGQEHVKRHRYTMGMAKKVSEDWANLLMNEKVQITLEGKKEQDFFDAVCSDNNFRVKSSEMQEMKAALGTVAYVPRIVGASVNVGTGKLEGKAEGIKLDYCTAEHIFPLSWENGKVIECAFSTSKALGKDKYLYLQIHRLDANKEYVIENVLFKDQNGQLSEVDNSSVEGFENVPTVVNTGSKDRQFVIDRPNIANNVNYLLPTGIAIYANAIDVLQGVDTAYDSYVNEFKLGKKRIMVKPSAAQYLDGTPAFDPDDVVFYVMPEDTEDGAVVTPIDMTLRTAEHNTGIQDQLNILSSKCGFGETYYRFDGGSVATATQVISENSTMFRTIKKHEIVLEQALVELCRILLRLGNTAMNAGLNEEVEISIDFDDSIIEDKQTDFSRDMQLLQAGIMNDWEFRMRWMNEDEATAKAALPKMQDMTTEQQNEVE